ncbi:MAG TPA: glycosyltransferase family 2 protein [Pyrinomonadaceae bacterium]|nr:glycosyltransferase family 2 protein [Pyrinomonadaceae bacterium]
MRQKLSVLLPTFNNAAIIRPTLESIRWVDEILVVDSFSTDNTLDICREYGARTIQLEYIQSARQKNWAIPQCTHEWVLQIDSDEVLEPGLREEIEAVLEEPPAELAGFNIPFKHQVLGRWVRVCGLYPEYHLRLFRRDRGLFEDKEVHAHVRVTGEVKTLENHIMHFGMTSLSKQLGNMDRYSRYQADELKKRGKRFRWSQVVLRPPAIFVYYYFWKLAFLAGYRGLWLAAISTTYDFWAHAKLWELEAFDLPASPR